jgi:hypothetical protein
LALVEGEYSGSRPCRFNQDQRVAGTDVTVLKRIFGPKREDEAGGFEKTAQ